MRRRLERHLPWRAALARDIVRRHILGCFVHMLTQVLQVAPQWVEECMRTGSRVSAQKFAAIRELLSTPTSPSRGTKRRHSEDGQEDETQTQTQTTLGPNPFTASGSSSLASTSSPNSKLLQIVHTSKLSTKPARTTIYKAGPSATGLFEFEQPAYGGTSPPVDDPTELPQRALLTSNFPPTATSAVQRLHPMVCPNQDIVAELAIIRFVDLRVYRRSGTDVRIGNSARSKAKNAQHYHTLVLSQQSKLIRRK
jgi:hypothetical protein